MNVDGRVFDLSPKKILRLEDQRRAFYARANVIQSLLFTVVLTDQCTMACDHCFEESGPNGTTFLDSSRLDDLAEEAVPLFDSYEDPGSIRITGGDPFLHPDLYDIIRAFSSRVDTLNYFNIDVETNGWWATDDTSTKKVVSQLMEAGAGLLSMTVDYFHCKQNVFPIYEHEKRIERISEEVGFNYRRIRTGRTGIDDSRILEELEAHKACCYGIVPSVTPIGRARSLDKSYWNKAQYIAWAAGCRLTPPGLSMEPEASTDEITIQSDGKVYLCNTGKDFEHVGLSIGNIYDASLGSILEARDNPIVARLISKGVRGLSKVAGLSPQEHQDLVTEMTPCGLCHELLREYGPKLARKIR